MYRHHKVTIDNITKKLSQQENVLSVIVCGSIAHGFETSDSDVDLMIVVSDEHYLKRLKTGSIHYFEKESCTYESGYIDGKYVSPEFIKQVEKKGSEPARFAFKGAFTTYSKISNLDDLIRKIARYPVERKKENICRFHAQLESWKWYCMEAIRHNNIYLLNFAASNLVLFAGRLVLAHNETLYPYHKWFIKVLENVQEKPVGFMAKIKTLFTDRSENSIMNLYRSIKDFRQWEFSGVNWPAMFMQDNELNWMNGFVPIADI